MTSRKRVAVIGAGPSGLCSIKAALEQDFEVVCFESSKSVGGLWNYNQRKGSSSIYESVISNTSKHMMQFSDFPIPKDWPRFLPHQKVQEYLEMYAENFNLKKYIKFGRRVESVHQEVVDGKETSRWELVYHSSKIDKTNGSKNSLDLDLVSGGNNFNS